jgi:general secretion pathway protein M
VSGSVAALETALQDLTTYVPLLLVESIEVFPDVRSRKRDAPPLQNVTASMKLLSLRALQ